MAQNDNEVSLSDLIGFAAGDNPAEFQTAYNKLMIGRTADVLQGAREIVAQQMIAPRELENLEDLDSESEGEDDDEQEEELDDDEQAGAGAEA